MKILFFYNCININYQQNFIYVHPRHEKRKFNTNINNSSTFQNLQKNENFFNIENIYLLKGKFYNIITNQNSSRTLQKILDQIDQNILYKILNEIKDDLDKIINDQYGNYFSQKFYKVLDKFGKIIFLLIISSLITNLSKNKLGTFTIQSIIDNFESTEEQIIIINSIKENILELCLVNIK